MVSPSHAYSFNSLASAVALGEGILVGDSLPSFQTHAATSRHILKSFGTSAGEVAWCTELLEIYFKNGSLD